MEETKNFIGARLKQSQFIRLGQFIEKEFGIKMPETKKVMLESRLHKRLRHLNMDNFEQYCKYLFSDEGFRKELNPLLNVVTTNKTDFFREPAHFDLLTHDILPRLYAREKRFSIWSAGCSSGEEPYTLVMVLLEAGIPRGSFTILATDISSKVLEKGMGGVYEMEKITDIPYFMKQKYMLKSKDPRVNKARMKPFVRGLVSFRQFNLMSGDFSSMGKMDIIFCRNVLIYFQRDIQVQIVNNFYNALNPGGYLFLGHSETLCNVNIPLQTVAPTVYRKV